MRGKLEARLSDSELVRAREGRYYAVVPTGKLFVVNLDKKDGIRVVWGWAFSKEPETDQFLKENGVSSDDCNLRFCAAIENTADWEKVCADIRMDYDAWKECSKDDLLDEVKRRRKAFMQQIAVRLKPLGFRKKGNRWFRELDHGFAFKVEAQKSAYSDCYYMNLSLKPKDDIFYGDCYYDRIRYPEGIVDWQLMPAEDFIALLEQTIENVIEPVLNTPFEQLGKERWLQENCICQRTKCSECWVEKNIWELKDENQNTVEENCS